MILPQITEQRLTDRSTLFVISNRSICMSGLKTVLCKSFSIRLFLSKQLNVCVCSRIMDNAHIPVSNIPTLDCSLKNGGTKHLLKDEVERPTKKLKTGSEGEFQNTESVRRKKVAMLLAYCGQGYYGMQRNPGMKTIEEDLLSAMLKAGIINQENFDVPQSMHFQRAARTDKGVSAARQVVSLRIALSPDLVEKINAQLPSVIKVFKITRTTKGFNSKLWCDARTYSYTLPTFAFAPSDEITTEDYRITEDVIKRVNSVLSTFKGTHNFHNFTSGKKPNDASAKRYIMEFQCGIPFIDSGIEFVVITVKGQSFMLHQIRKMIGLTIAIVRDLASADIIEKAWEKDKVDIPVAPGVGLMLEELHYEKYNNRYANDGLHDALNWEALSEEINRFKTDYICRPIVEAEKNEKSMFQWLLTLPLHTYDVREEGPPLPVDRSQTRSEFGRALVAVEIQNRSQAQEESQAVCPDTESPDKAASNNVPDDTNKDSIKIDDYTCNSEPANSEDVLSQCHQIENKKS